MQRKGKGDVKANPVVSRLPLVWLRVKLCRKSDVFDLERLLARRIIFVVQEVITTRYHTIVHGSRMVVVVKNNDLILCHLGHEASKRLDDNVKRWSDLLKMSHVKCQMPTTRRVVRSKRSSCFTTVGPHSGTGRAYSQFLWVIKPIPPPDKSYSPKHDNISVNVEYKTSCFHRRNKTVKSTSPSLTSRSNVASFLGNRPIVLCAAIVMSINRISGD